MAMLIVFDLKGCCAIHSCIKAKCTDHENATKGWYAFEMSSGMQEEQDQFAGLFKKTAAKPHLYYLPLTKEQIAAKHGSGQKPGEVIKSA